MQKRVCESNKNIHSIHIQCVKIVRKHQYIINTFNRWAINEQYARGMEERLEFMKDIWWISKENNTNKNVILLNLQNITEHKITKLPWYVLHSLFSYIALLGLISLVPPYLGNTLPLNNITKFTKKEISQYVGLQDISVSCFFKGRMSLGESIH